MTETIRTNGVRSALYSLFMRSIASRGRLLTLGLLSILGIGIAIVVARATDIDHDAAAVEFTTEFGLTLLLPLGCLVFASAAFGDLREDQTMVYLWLRPTPTPISVLGAFGAACTAAGPFTILALTVAAGVIGSERVVLGTLLATTLGALAYCGVFLALGLRVRHALAWGLAYILIWEGYVASVGGFPNKLAVRTYTRSALVHTVDIEPNFDEVAYAPSIIVPIAVTIAALTYAVHRFRTQDVD